MKYFNTDLTRFF